MATVAAVARRRQGPPRRRAAGRALRSGHRCARTRAARAAASCAVGAVQADDQPVLLDLTTSELKRELRARGLDTSTSFDREALLELGEISGLLPSSLGSADVRPRRRLAPGIPRAPVIVALRRLAAAAEDYIPSGPYSDGERLAVPLWHEFDSKRSPSWFMLDTAISRSLISETLAQRIGIRNSKRTAIVRGLHFAGEPAREILMRVVPDESPLFGPLGSRADGLLGLDFLHDWDIDLDIRQGVCRAWRSGPELSPDFGASFGLEDALEVPLTGGQGLLELGARLRGTVCSGSDRAGPRIRALVDLGQTFSACNWVAARQVGVENAAAPCVRPAGRWASLHGGDLEVFEAEMGVEIHGRASGVLRGVRLCERRRFWIADSLPVLERLGFSPSEPCASLGLDTVGRSRLGISARHRRLWIPQ